MGWRGRSGAWRGRVLLPTADSATQATLRAMLATSESVTTIDEAWTLEEAFVSCSHSQIVLLDVKAVGEDGLPAAVAALRAGGGSPAVVVVADESDPAVVRQALDAGAVSFLLTWSD